MLKKERIVSDLIRQRLFFIRRAEKIGVASACRELGKYRSQYYYWIKRYQTLGWRGLQNQSCRPRHMPRLSRPALVRAICEARRSTNGLGKERLHDYLADDGLKIPVSTIGKILEREGLLVKKRSFKTQKKHTRSYNLLKPGERVQLDIKYVPSAKCPPGKRFYQYTVIDECTRMRHLTWHDSIWNLRAVESLKAAQNAFGFKINCVQTDNGIEFTFNYTAQLQARHKPPVEHPLDLYCKEARIKHKLIPPGEKEINGKVERSHRTDEEEFYRPLQRVRDLKELRARGRIWNEFYNNRRRHSGIGKKTPRQFCEERLKIYPEQKL